MALSSNPRLILAKLREGDYAHAGGEEAIDIVFQQVKEKLASQDKLRILDAGCGLGGTAAWVYKKIPSEIYGIDIDANAIEHAQKTYPTIKFDACDILDVSKKTNDKFNLIYMFNVFYAIKNQPDALKELRQISDPETLLVIFDYTDLKENKKKKITDLAGKELNPISIGELKKNLVSTGWKLIKIINLDAKYQTWYEDFITKLRKSKSSLLADFTEEAYEKVLSIFSLLLAEIKEKSIGGAAIYARACK